MSAPTAPTHAEDGGPAGSGADGSGADGSSSVGGRPARRRGGMRDLVLSLAVLLALVGVFVLASPRESGNPSAAIDYTNALISARDVAPFPVVAPVGLPKGWEATSTRTDVRDGTVHWHLALRTPTQQYASVDQSDRPADVFVAEMTERGQVQGTVSIRGTTWVRTYASLRDHRALWSSSGAGATTVVGGTASWADLEQLAASLQGPSALAR